MNLSRFHILSSSLLIILLTGFIISAKAAPVSGNDEYKFMHIDINDGLSNNEILAIMKDSQGFMWFATAQGLNRYDGTNFKSFVHSITDSTSIPYNQVDFLFQDADQQIWIRSQQSFIIYNPFEESFNETGSRYMNTSIPIAGLQSMFADSKGNTWLVNQNYGLYKYSHDNGTADSILFSPETISSANNNYLYSASEDSNGFIWAVSNAGEIIKVNPDSNSITKRFFLGKEATQDENKFKLFIDSDNDIWLYAPGQPFGVYVIENQTEKIKNYRQWGSDIVLSNNMVSSVVEDENKLIWIATDHGGINIIDKKRNTVKLLTTQSDNQYSISQNSVTELYNDDEGMIWAGTFKKGINYYHKSLVSFNHIKHSSQVPNSLPYNDVNCFVEDNHGNLWIGTNGGGLIYYNRTTNQFTSYKNDPDNPRSLSADVIVSLFIDRTGILWVGTYLGGLNRFNGNYFKRYIHNPDDPNSISDDRIWDIMEDSKQNLWIGTLNGGLNLFNRKSETFVHYKAEDINSVGANFIMSIIEDHEQNLWLGTTNGLDMLNLNTKRFRQYEANPNEPGHLSHGNVVDIHEDSRGLIWAATPQGLNVLDKNEGKFQVFTEADGLVNSNIKTILEDEEGNIWISTIKGISKITVENYTGQMPINELKVNVENFGLLDGLQGYEFNQKAAYRTRSGELIFGGANGFNLFNPKNIIPHQSNERIILTNFKVFNNEVKANKPFGKRIILDKAITYHDKITLKHNENVFSFEFAAINFFHPEKDKYQYQLAGFNKQWLNVNPGNNEISFTNLDAGTYQLHIRVSNDNMTGTEMSPPLTIKILPPFWKTIYAYILYVILLFVILFLIWRSLSERQRLKFEAEQEHREAERIQQIDNLKTKFFTNISHEFRTPISLIISPLEKLIEKSKDEDQRNHLILIHRNARRLLAMVNQLLDFRKMELQKIEVKPGWGEMIGFVKEIATSFEDLVENREIDFRFSGSCEKLYTFFDKDKTDKIITNLLSNAFKFTPENGTVSLKLELNKEDKNAAIRMIVSDTGIGIPFEKQDRIFDRFYQSELPSSEFSQGSGIGLSMVKEYVNLLNGTVSVESIVNKGSTFTVELPVVLYSNEEIEKNNQMVPVINQSVSQISGKMEASDQPEYDKKKKTLAIVEDNADFRFYLKENLKGRYNILEAENGAKGWKLTESKNPDIVVSDVMMPEIDGVELCKKIKTHRTTKHIPVILLTAKADTQPVIEGFESGADAYITKPFDFRILESRIENLLNSREQLRKSYQSMIGINPEKIEVNSEDEKFIKKALQVVESYISESSFSVEDFGAEMGMSRVSLYKKILALTDKTPIEFIRIIRLKRAADLLISSQLSVSEIAYQVGFNNPRYFSKYFSQEYQMLPSEYITKNRRDKAEISKEMKDKFS